MVERRAATGGLQLSFTPRATVALDHLLTVGVVVVGELLTRRDVPARANPDVFPDDLAVAIRLAGVIDEARHVATDGRIADPAAVDGKTPNLAALEVLRLALEALFVIDQLAVVGHDPRVLVDGLEGKNAPSVER